MVLFVVEDVAQDKKVTSTHSCARWEEVSNGATPICFTSQTNVPKTRQGQQPGQEDGLGSQPTSQGIVDTIDPLTEGWSKNSRDAATANKQKRKETHQWATYHHWYPRWTNISHLGKYR